MKKIDLMLKLLFIVVFANVSYGQGGAYLPTGSTCATAVPITTANFYTLPSDGISDYWYTFVAPCDGDLTLSHSGYANEVTKRIYSGSCLSLVLERNSDWSVPVTPSYLMDEGETAIINVNDSWDGIGQFDVKYRNPLCPNPTALSSFVTSYSTATLAWFAGGSETNWLVTYGPVGFDPEVDGVTVPVAGSPLVGITGLEELTCYQYYVRAICAGGETSCFLSGPVTFCTPAICPAPLSPNEIMITGTTTRLDWTNGAAETAWDVEWGDEGFEIGDGTFLDALPAPTDEDVIGLEPGNCYDWYVRAQCLVDLGDGPEIVHSLWVGPNEWCATAICVNPSGLTMIATDGISATLSWTENNTPPAEEWNIQYGAPGFTLGTGVTVTNIPANPFTLGGLTPDTDYCYYVQAVCGEGADSLSGWAGPYCFTTGIYCDEPSGLFAESTSGTEADLAWIPGGAETEWEVSWGVDLTDPLDGSIEDAAILPGLTLTGLEPGESYCYYVRTVCGEEEEEKSAWAGPFCWDQQALCATPSLVNAIGITNTAAFINFSAPGGENYDLQWGLPCFEVESGDEIGLVDATEDKPYYITGLEESTPYWVYVRSNCGVDSISDWAGPVLFGTQISNDNPCDAEELVLDGPSLLRHNFAATVLAGETALNPGSDACTGTDGWCSGDGVDRTVWFKFTAPASGQVRVSTFNESNCITNGRTEIALYTTGDCAIIGNFIPQYANSNDAAATDTTFGSTIVACGLTPGQEYYVMVNPISFVQQRVHFGIELTSIEEVAAGLGLSPTICAGSDYDLFTAIAGYSDEDGTWYNPTVAPGNVLDNEVTFPDVVGSFDFYYVVSNGCDADTVMTTVSTENSANAGGDGFFVTCNVYDVILSDHLSGDYDGGGIWSYTGDDIVTLAGGLFVAYGDTAGVYTFNYTVSNEFCPTDTAVVTITLTDCMGTDEQVENTLVVYPNPVVDVLTVQNVAIEGNAVIEVLDIEGRVIISKNVSNVFGNYTIDMSGVESGVYFVKVTADTEVQKVRVVKQ